ncbi:MAG: maleylpyruvate isomerase family mycothiol-dependent enzyme [Acidimicrobiales bacterium]
MKAKETWTYIHAERAAMADTWAGLSADQWVAKSWCEGWTVQMTAGHVLAAAEQTPLNFYKELLAAGMKFDVFTARGAERLAAVGPEELVRRLRARTSTTNHPPAPVVAMLGEIVVHGEDIRRPLGLHHEVPEGALVAVADSWKKTNLLIGAKRRIAGLSLRATDTGWSTGDGPEVAGPMVSLLLAMGGRRGAHADLSGDGLALFAARA